MVAAQQDLSNYHVDILRRGTHCCVPLLMLHCSHNESRVVFPFCGLSPIVVLRPRSSMLERLIEV